MGLSEWMDREGLTDAEMAARIGGSVGRSQINRIRRGVSRPSVEVARQLEAVTQIPFVDLLLGEAA